MLWIWGAPRITLKVIIFQASLQGNKSQENWFQGQPKSQKMDSGIMRNQIAAKNDFRDTSLAKCLVFESQTPRFKPKKHQRKQPGDKMKRLFLFGPRVPNKTLRMGPLNQQQIDKIQAWTSKCPPLCSPMSQDRSRIVPGSPRTPE